MTFLSDQKAIELFSTLPDDIQAKLTWMVDSLLSSRVALADDGEDTSEPDEGKLIAGLIRSIRGERVKKSTLNKLGSLPEVCAPIARLDEQLASLSSGGSSDDFPMVESTSVTAVHT